MGYLTGYGLDPKYYGYLGGSSSRSLANAAVQSSPGRTGTQPADSFAEAVKRWNPDAYLSQLDALAGGKPRLSMSAQSQVGDTQEGDGQTYEQQERQRYAQEVRDERSDRRYDPGDRQFSAPPDTDRRYPPEPPAPRRYPVPPFVVTSGNPPGTDQADTWLRQTTQTYAAELGPGWEWLAERPDLTKAFFEWSQAAGFGSSPKDMLTWIWAMDLSPDKDDNRRQLSLAEIFSRYPGQEWLRGRGDIISLWETGWGGIGKPTGQDFGTWFRYASSLFKGAATPAYAGVYNAPRSVTGGPPPPPPPPPPDTTRELAAPPPPPPPPPDTTRELEPEATAPPPPPDTTRELEPEPPRFNFEAPPGVQLQSFTPDSSAQALGKISDYYRNVRSEQARDILAQLAQTGDIHGGGAGLTMERAMRNLGTAQGREGAQLIAEVEQRNADRALQIALANIETETRRYGIDRDAQVQLAISKLQDATQRYGVDRETAVRQAIAELSAAASRYGADKQLAAAIQSAQAAAGAAAAQADAARYAANLDFQGLGMRLSQQERESQRGYDLGLHGINRDIYGIDMNKLLGLLDFLRSVDPNADLGELIQSIIGVSGPLGVVT